MDALYMHLTLNSTKFQIQEGSGGGGGLRSDLLDLSNMYKPNQYVNIFPLSQNITIQTNI